MTTLYKLTDEFDCTRNHTQWGVGVTHTASGKGELCSNAWLHAYTHPILAFLLNPIHANFRKPHLWECEGDVGITDHGLKVGCTKLTTLRRLHLPQPYTEACVAFAIGCVYQIYRDPAWVEWARAWVIGSNRSYTAVTAAYATAATAATAAAAARAATAAAAAAARAYVPDAAYAAYAADAAAAYAADAAAVSAVDARAVLPLHELADWAMTIR